MIRITATFIFTLFMVTWVHADGWLSNTQVHGFLSQGFVKTTDNRFFGDSENGSFDFTEIGLNSSLRLGQDLLVTGQILSRTAGNMYDGTPAIDYALIRWNLIDDVKNQVGISLGRLKNPFGLYNQTRDVAHTRPSIFLPEVVYYDKVRNLVLAGDGVGLHLRRFGDVGELAFDLHIAKLLVDENVEAAFLGKNWAGHIDNADFGYLGQLRWTTPDERWHLALSYVDITLKYHRGVTDPFDSGETHVQLGVGSLQYNNDNWTFTTEYVYEPLEWRDYDIAQPGYLKVDETRAAESYYFQVEHHLNSNVSFLARYEEGYAIRSDRDGSEASQVSISPSHPHNYYSKIKTIGARWNVSPQFMLCAEFAMNEGTFILSSIENSTPLQARKDWNMFSLLASYQF